MTQHNWGKLVSVLAVLAAVAVIIWACGGAEQSATPSSVQEEAAPASEPSTVEATMSSAAVITSSSAELGESGAAVSADVSTGSNAGASNMVRVFTIEAGQSQARFTLDEELMGSPKTVVGATSLVNGAITIDLADLSKTSISPIQIDARGLATDSARRDGAIQRFVLGSSSDANRFIVFTPTAITGFPAAAAVGDTLALQVTGDLTISGVTNPVTFATTVTVASETQIRGLATAQVLRSDFGLTIPSVPSVANVSDDVQLELEFVAGA